MTFMAYNKLIVAIVTLATALASRWWGSDISAYAPMVSDILVAVTPGLVYLTPNYVKNIADGGKYATTIQTITALEAKYQQFRELTASKTAANTAVKTAKAAVKDVVNKIVPGGATPSLPPVLLKK